MNDLVARIRVEAEARQAIAATDQLGGAMTRAGASARGSKAGFDQAAAGVSNFERQAGSARAAATAVGAAMAALGAREFVQNANQAAFASQGFNTALSAVAGGAAGARSETAFLAQESARLGLVVRDQTSGMVNLAGATQGTKLEGQETREIWLGLVEAGTALNSSAEKQGRALEAVGQIASKQVVAMEEVRGQLAEAIPGATGIAARAMGMTTAEFIKTVSAGKLLAEDFLPKFAAELRNNYGPALDAALNSPLGRARKEMAETANSGFTLQAAFGRGFLSGAVDGVASLNDELAKVKAQDSAARLGEDLGRAFGSAAEVAGVLADNIDLVVTAAQMLAGVALARWLNDVGAAAIRATAATRAKAAAQVAAAEAALAEARANLQVASTGLIFAQRQAAVATALNQVNAAKSRATALTLGLRGAMGSLVALMGGPLGIAIAAGVAGWAYFAEAEQKAAQAAQALADTKTNALSAMERALEFTERYGVANDNLKTAIDGVTSGQAGATRETDGSVGATDRAADAARRRAEVERLLTVELLRKAAADAMARGRDAQQAGERLAVKSTIGGAMAAMGTGDIAFGQKVQAQSDSEKKSVQSFGAATQSFNLAKQLHEQANALAAADLAVGKSAGVAEEAHKTVAAAAGGRAKKTDEAREAERRIAAAQDMVVSSKLETEALKQRAAAAGLGAAALEDLQVAEARMQVLDRLGVESLDKLTGAVRTHAQAAMDAAEVRERQAIATEKAEKVGARLRDLDLQIQAERARGVALRGGAQAMAEFAKAEAVRQEIERTGQNLTAEQIAQIRQKVELLLQVQAANDNAEAAKGQREELELLALTNEERDIEIRTRQIAIRLQRENLKLTDDEAKLRARIIAMQDMKAEDRARELGELKDGLKRAFIESGELGFDQVGQYALRKLREAIYEAFLKKPIDIILNATINGLGGSAGGGGLGALLGSLKGGLNGLAAFAGTPLGAAGIGTMIGQSLGFGTGKPKTDALIGLGGGLAGVGLAGSMAGGYIGAGVANAALGMGASTAMAGSMGALLSSAAVLGPLAAVAALAVGTLFKDDKRPYARTDFGVANGKFAVSGGQELDKGPLDKTNQAADQIVQSLNAAATLFKLDLTKLSGNMGSVGYVEGKNTGALGQGWFGGGGGGFSGAEFSGSKDPEKLAAEIVKSTIIKAINAGASDLSAAEKNVVLQAANLEDAANKIAAGRSIAQTIEDAMLQLTNPAEFERKQALAAIEASYQAMKTQAEDLIKSGLVSGDVLTKLEKLKTLQVEDAMRRLGAAADDAANRLKQGNDFKAELNEAYLKIVDPAAYQQARGVREISAAIEAMKTRAEGLIAQGVVGPEVLGQIEQLKQLQLADLARQVAETADVFAQGKKTIKSWLEGLSGSVYAELSPAAAKEMAVADYRRQLAKAQGGDVEAFNSITGYADRALSADRNATENAQQRLAFANQVRAEMEALTQTRGGSGASTALEAQMKLFGIPLNKLVITGEATKAANDEMVTALKPSLAVSLANVPMLRAAYGEVAKAENDRLISAIEKLGTDLLGALGGRSADTSSTAQSVLEGLAASLGAMSQGVDQQTQASRDASAAIQVAMAMLRKRGMAA